MQKSPSSPEAIFTASLPAGARIVRELQKGEKFKIGCAYLDFSSMMQPNLLVYTGGMSGGFHAFDRYDLKSGRKIGSLIANVLNTAYYLVKLPDGFLKNPEEEDSLPDYPPVDMKGRIEKLFKEAKKGEHPIKE